MEKNRNETMQPIQRTAQTMDGNQAAAHVAYAYSEAAAIYPITPSSPMAELCDTWAGAGRKNIYGAPLVISQLQSEAGAAGAVHGALLAGALATTFTSSQGLLLMLPNLYRIAGELLPGVIHVAARSIATHALSIFGDHSDIYACRQTGAAIFAAGSVQEVMDISPVPHLAALEGRIPFLNFFDGFRTSHELQKIQVWDYADLKALSDPSALQRFRQESLHPHHGKVYGSAQNPDIFFQNREAANPFYLALPAIVEKHLGRVNSLLGTDYGLFDYYGHPQAEHIVVAMGSVCETIKEYLDNVPEEKYGLISIHLYRPFSVRHFVEKLPQTAKQITVLSRTKEPGAPGEPLYLDVTAALEQAGLLSGGESDASGSDASSSAEASSSAGTPSRLQVFSGRYGLSSKDTTPAQIAAVYANRTQKFFTVGINDNVTQLSLPLPDAVDTTPADVVSCKFWGLGGDGTVSATKNAIKIIGDYTDMTAQGYFEYDSKKSRGLTISHLRFGKTPIRSAYLISKADFVACHNPVYLHKYEMLQECKDGGSFLLNCPYRGKELEAFLPQAFKSYAAAHQIRLFIIDAIGIGKEIGLNNKISTILQAAFFAVSGLLAAEEAKSLMKAAAAKSYGKMGDKILRMNEEAIDRGFAEVTELELPDTWKDCTGQSETAEGKQAFDSGLDNPVFTGDTDSAVLLDFVKKIQQPTTDQRGNELPVSAFLPYSDGFTPPGSTAHERRNVATEVPEWIPENCIQCNRCSFVCPHAVIRPALLDEKQLAAAPEGLDSVPALGLDGQRFSIVISEVDCTGCGACAGICPGKQGNKALAMHPVREHAKRQQYFDYCKPLLPNLPAAEKFGAHTVKGSQFLRPLMEFSGACAGCGETPYVKLLTQLFGPNMYIANATGCSSIWGNSSPSCAYTVDADGHGPAWSNSLFEDAAEFGYGMLMAQEAAARRQESATAAEGPSQAGAAKAEDAAAMPETRQNHAATAAAKAGTADRGRFYQWVVGGDGWAYDIGFGGLDHVLASGKNINILVLDTEVYSNTGGQASKATPLGSTAKFVSGGKRTPKKDLAAIAMTYGNVYVAQIAMGADLNQTVKALTEAAAYPGPSLVIAYATCIAHGIRAGLGSTAHEQKKAVDAGYFHLFRFHPGLREQGKNPFLLDSKEPQLDYQEFLKGEIRYDALTRENPEEAEKLFAEAAERAKARYEQLKKLEAFYAPSR